MLKLSDHLYIEPMGRVIERERMAKKVHKRFAAAKGGRLNAGWTTNPESANFVLRQGVRILRARAREMAADSPHFKKYLSMCRSNIIGQNGIQLQVRARKPDTTLNADLNKRVEMAFWEWSYAETCTISGKLDWLAAQRLFVTQLARDGEVLVQKVKAKNDFGFALKFIDVSYLDEGFNRMLPSGNRILMSVEVDGNDRPVAYWLTTPSTELEFRRNIRRDPVRVPADEMIHAFLVHDDESQVRGITFFAAALMQGKSLASYVEGVVTQARMTAMSLGFIEEEFPAEEEYVGQEDAEGNERPMEINFHPGGFTKLNPGEKLSQWDPKQPTQNHSAFKKSMEMDLATALDLNYFDLSGDLEAVNYSSARVGLGESREIWRTLQDFVSAKFCREVYHAWLPAALMSGKLDVTADEYTQIFNPYWRPRGWPYIDPQKEVKSALEAINGGILTKTAHFAAQGIDLVDWLEEKKQEMELFAKAGVEYAPPVQPGPSQPDNNKPDDENDEEDEIAPPKRSFLNGHDMEMLN